MKKMKLPILAFTAITVVSCQRATEKQITDGTQSAASSLYVSSRAPLKVNPYVALPLGSIKPHGWLKEMLLTQAKGSTAHLDSLYPQVMGARNGWRGGDGDQWERGPYWIKGLVPLAYILGDSALIAKAKPWIEWTLASQDSEGHFGPAKDYGPERGIQRDNARDWWPKMVMLNVLQQYYSATGDQRVITLMTNYFKYQLKTLPEQPLGHWTFWATYRGGDNLASVYWLYNITGDKFLLELADLLYKQTFDYTNMVLKTDRLAIHDNIHCVNLAEGMKTPVVYSQHHTDSIYSKAFRQGLMDIRKYLGQPQGMFGGDESLRDDNPTNGSELCSAVELMLTLENALPIAGEVSYADHLERIAFNALPTQIADDFNSRQYFQQVNQVMCTRHDRNFSVNHNGTDVCFGLLTGYPCCTSNMHMGWPMFTQNLWYATPDRGIASLVFSPSEVTAKVGNGTEVTIREETNYPFDETIRYHVQLNAGNSMKFPFDVRIPAWCKEATLTINGEPFKKTPGNTIVRIDREWKSNDVVALTLPMEVRQSRWHERSATIERGPLVYALKIGEQWKKVTNDKDPIEYGTSYFEVRPTAPWNYGLVQWPDDKLAENFKVTKKGSVSSYPWNVEHAPIEIRAKAKRMPQWSLYNETAGPLPYSEQYGQVTASQVEEVTLIPYGCTTLRITEFPLVGNYGVQ